MLMKPLMKRIPADAPRRYATGSRLSHGPAVVVRPVVHRPVVPHVLRLACGFLAHTGKRTVCGMLTGAGLSRRWSHDRAHYFLARAPLGR